MIQLKSIENASVYSLRARIVSDILNPLTLPLLVFGVAGWVTGQSVNNILEILGVSALLFFVLPALSALAISKFGGERSFDFHSRTSRTALYLTSILSIGLGGLIIFNEIYTNIYGLILMIYLVNLMTAFVLNFKMKVSVHVGSVVAASVLLSWLAFSNLQTVWPSLIAVVMLGLVPLVAWSRFQLNVHSWFEILWGGIMGFTMTILMILLLA
jgi:hypothetical protein